MAHFIAAWSKHLPPYASRYYATLQVKRLLTSTTMDLGYYQVLVPHVLLLYTLQSFQAFIELSHDLSSMLR